VFSSPWRLALTHVRQRGCLWVGTDPVHPGGPIGVVVGGDGDADVRGVQVL